MKSLFLTFLFEEVVADISRNNKRDTDGSDRQSDNFVFHFEEPLSDLV